jgi:imidazolonepropionase-like amidohydrolase
MILLKNALVMSMIDEPFIGSIAMEGGKIVKVARGIPDLDAHEKIDLAGAIITPGFIDAHTHQGLFQGDIGWAGMDGNEMTDPITPHLRAIDAINPMDPGLQEAPAGGVTTINTGPGSANVMGGLFCCLKTAGSIVDEMLALNPSCLKIAFGENPKAVYGKHEKNPQTRMAIAALMREWFAKARDYARKQGKLRECETDDKIPDTDIKLEVLTKVLNRELPVHAHCHRADDIVTALRIAEEFNLKLVLIHATAGHQVAEFLALKGIPVVVGPSFVGREKVELRDISFKTPGILAKAGVRVCLQSDTFPPLTYFQSILCMAIKEGMDRLEALKAVTINPAEVLGISRNVGSIAEGKDADIVVWSGDPREFYSRVEMTFINGKKAFEAGNK